MPPLTFPNNRLPTPQATTCSSSLSLPSLGSNTLALGSCLYDNRSKTRQRQAVVLSSIPPYKPPRKPLRPLRPLRLCVPFSHSLLTLNTEYGGKGAWRSDILSLCVHWNAYACDVYTISLSSGLYLNGH